MLLLLAVTDVSSHVHARLPAGDDFGGSLNDLITRHVLLSIWGSQLTIFAVLVAIAIAVVGWLAWPRKRLDDPLVPAVDIAERLRYLEEN